MERHDPLEAVYREHTAPLFRFLMRLTGNEAETKDVLQEIFVRLARKPSLLKEIEAPRSYLFRLAHRLVIDRFRRTATRERYEEAVCQESETVAKPEEFFEDQKWSQEVLKDALESLPPEQKAVIALKIWEEMTFVEIADILEISPHTAASRYRYALDKLRSRLRSLQQELP